MSDRQRPSPRVGRRAVLVNTDPTSNYVERMLKLAELVKLKGKRGAAVMDAYIRHDGWCPMFKGQPCRCNPELALVGVDGDGNRVRFRMSEDGELETDA